MRVLLKGPLLAVSLSLCAPVVVPLHATTPGSVSGATPDTARLRQALATALGEDFTITRTELSSGLRERGGTFWLVHARPRRSGDYELRYQYLYRDRVRPNDPLYTHVEHKSYVRVGERGCWRRREGKDVCLGDTIILPFVVDDYTGHVFTVGRRGSSAEGGAGEREPAPPVELAPEVDSVANPLSAHLRYLGTSSYRRLRRNGGGSVVHSAEFQAVAPGSFNLALAGGTSAAGSMPIVIAPRGQPVTVLLARETVVGTDRVQGFSSHSGNEYLTAVLLLQPGDRISLEYHHYTFSAREEFAPGRRVLDAPEPVITGLPFHLDPGVRFNAWIAAHLP